MRSIKYLFLIGLILQSCKDKESSEKHQILIESPKKARYLKTTSAQTRFADQVAQ